MYKTLCYIKPPDFWLLNRHKLVQIICIHQLPILEWYAAPVNGGAPRPMLGTKLRHCTKVSHPVSFLFWIKYTVYTTLFWWDLLKRILQNVCAVQFLRRYR